MSATNQTTRLILNYLFDHRVFAYRNNVTGIPLPNGGFRPAAKTGLPDIIAILPPDGKFCGIEIKTGRDTLRPEQQGFIANVARSGGICLVVKDFEDFLDKFSAMV